MAKWGWTDWTGSGWDLVGRKAAVKGGGGLSPGSAAGGC